MSTKQRIKNAVRRIEKMPSQNDTPVVVFKPSEIWAKNSKGKLVLITRIDMDMDEL